MKISTRLMSICVVAISMSLLAGCSGEPSASDIEKAMQSNIDQTAQQIEQMGGKSAAGMAPKLFSAKKIGCASAQGDSGYNCDVEIDSSSMFTGRTKRVAKLRFVKGSDGWVVSQ